MGLNRHTLASILFLVSFRCVSQSSLAEKTVEESYKVTAQKVSLAGYLEGKPFFIKRAERGLNQFKSYVIDEVAQARDTVPTLFISPFPTSHLSTGYLSIDGIRDDKWIFNVGYWTEDSKIYYQNLWIQHSGKDYLLDSIYNCDKLVHFSFSQDGKLLLANTLNTLSDYYNPEQDDQIMVYNLSQIDHGIIKKESIPCVHCSNSHLIGDQLFFMKANKRDAYDGFSNTEIYRAPWGQVNDTTRIASNSKIVAISPDGKYILATRFFDLQKNTCVIIDVEKKKYQLLLGRDYAKARAFYSYHEKKFAFDFGGWIVYVDYPKNYPFDALKWRNDGIPDFTDKAFWSQYEHPPFGQN